MTKQKKIAIVCNYALNPNRIGGMDRFYVAYDAKAKALGYEVDWYFSNYQPFDFFTGLTVFSANNQNMEQFFLEKVNQENLKYDVLVTHFLALCTSFFKNAKVLGVQKTIAVDHNPRPLGGFPFSKIIKNKIKGILYSRYIDHFVGVSEYTRKHILKDYGFFLTNKTSVIKSGKIPDLKLSILGLKETEIEVEIRLSSKIGNFTPDVTIAKKSHKVFTGSNELVIGSDYKLDADQYVFYIIHKNTNVKVEYSDIRITGVLSVFNTINVAVSNYGKQEAPDNIGIDSFEFWVPQRRPEGKNLAFSLSEPISSFELSNLKGLVQRPTFQTNAWVASLFDDSPELRIKWDQKQSIQVLKISFDPDWDHPLESVLINHPESIIPFCVQDFSVYDDQNRLVFEKAGNYETMIELNLQTPLLTNELVIRLSKTHDHIPVSLFSIQIY